MELFKLNNQIHVTQNERKEGLGKGKEEGPGIY